MHPSEAVDTGATVGPEMKRFTAKQRYKLFSDLALTGVAIAFVIPMLWMLLAAFDGNAGLVLKLPEQWSISNFSEILNSRTIGRPMVNSLLISIFASLIVVVFSVFAAYPLSRYKMRYGKTYIYTMLFASALPVTAIMVPVYLMFVNFKMVDSITGVILFRAASQLPYAVWLMKSFMDAIPIELEEAAWVDGASRLRGAVSVGLPLLWPAILTIFILNFIENWGNFFVPFILLQSQSNYPLAVSLYSLFGQYGEVMYGQLAAFSVVYTAPSLLLYFLVAKPLQQGFRMGGAVKA